MASITLFAAATQATGQQLDDNLTLISNQAPIPCTAVGTNTITLAQKSNVYAVTAYTNNMQFSAIAAATNTNAATAALGLLGALNIYKDSPAGPVALSGGEIVIGCAFTLLYDPALNTGAGGFHLFSNTSPVAGQTINPTAILVGSTLSTLSRYLSTTQSISFTVFGAASAQDTLVLLSGVRPGDAIMLGPPSLSALNPVAFFGYVAASGSVLLRGVNAAAAGATVAPGVWRVTGIG